MAELASFRADDPDELVEASLCCPLCLHRCRIVSLDGDPFDAHARCCCTACRHDRTVELLPEQFLRLSLSAAPAG